jgi:hypothetical protein
VKKYNAGVDKSPILRYNTNVKLNQKQKQKVPNMKGPSTTRGFIIGAVALLAIVFLSSQVQASVKPEIRRGEVIDSNIIDNTVSDIVSSEFPFQMIGVKWRGEESAKIAVRYFNADGWSEWYSVGETVKNSDWYYSREPIIANGATKFQYSVTQGALDELNLIYLGETKKLAFSRWNPIKVFSKASAESSLDIIPRSGWEADEDLRFDGASNEIWPTEYQDPEKFVIHHTAGGDGGNDPAGTIRGIYYWHATVLGWGDIGYNYLIDQNGNIYEGRSGGDGAVGAHVYRNKACAISRFGGAEYEKNFNKGTVGISVLGDYEDLELNSAVKSAITRLIANKAVQFAIEPNGESFFFDNTYPNIVGHKDLDCTLCPGANLYQELDAIRSETQNAYDQLGGRILSYAAKLASNTIKPAMFAGDQQTVTFKFRNQGKNDWEKGKVYLNIYDLGDKPSRLYLNSWPGQYGHINFSEEIVKTGELATFTFDLKAPLELGMFKNIYRVMGPEEIIQRESFSITRIDSQYSAKLVSHTIPLAVLNKWRVPVVISFKNTGLGAWNKSMVLQVFDLGGKTSVFRDSSWANSAGNIVFNENEVQPGKTATFNLYLKSPSQVGLYLNSFKLGIPGREIVVQGGEFTQITRVDI